MQKLKRVIVLILGVITMCAACLFTFGCNGGEKYTLEFYLYDYEKYGQYTYSEKGNYSHDFQLLTSVKTTAPRQGTYYKQIRKELKTPYDEKDRGIYVSWVEQSYEGIKNRYHYSLIAYDSPSKDGVLTQKGRYYFEFDFAPDGVQWYIECVFQIIVE